MRNLHIQLVPPMPKPKVGEPVYYKGVVVGRVSTIVQDEVSLDIDAWNVDEVLKDAGNLTIGAIEVGRQKILDEPPPPWSMRQSSGEYLEVGAQLCTRDGRKSGNAVVISLAETADNGARIATVRTDMGNTMRLYLSELKEMFYPPRYVMNVAEHKASSEQAVRPPTDPHGFEVFDLVQYTAESGCHLRSGAQAYDHAVVACVDPLILISHHGDMLWRNTVQPKFLHRIGKLETVVPVGLAKRMASEFHHMLLDATEMTALERAKATCSDAVTELQRRIDRLTADLERAVFQADHNALVIDALRHGPAAGKQTREELAAIYGDKLRELQQRHAQTVSRLEADAKAANAQAAVSAAFGTPAVKVILGKLEEAARASRTGVTLEHIYHAEDGRVTANGFRLISYHNPGPVAKTLVEAIHAFTVREET